MLLPVGIRESPRNLKGHKKTGGMSVQMAEDFLSVVMSKPTECDNDLGSVLPPMH